MENKELLETAIHNLKEKFEKIQKDLKLKSDQLADINKPKISQSQYEIVEDVIFNNMIDALDRLEERTNYDVEMELSGNEINIYNIDFHDSNNVAEYIMEKVNEKFNVVEDEEDETTTDNS